MKMHSLIRAVHVDGRIVDAEAAHQLKALATPAAGAASARPPSAKPPGDGAEGEAMPGTTATRSAHLAPAGGLAAASAEAPAAGRWQGGGTIGVGLHLAAERVLQVVEAIGAAVRRPLAWCLAAAPHGRPPTPPSVAGRGASAIAPSTHIPSSPPPPGNDVAPIATRRPTP
jgi:hypothetical protein